jgi:chromosome transmission fidelity protein 1
MGEEGRLHDFRDQILASPKDIEDLVTAGHSAHTCPYFASRAAIPQAEVRGLRSICDLLILS